MSADLVAWLRRQIDTDERIARAAAADTWNVMVEGKGAAAMSVHVAANDPAHALRRVHAHREILEEYERAVEYYNAHRSAPAGEVTGLWFAVKSLASIYSDRPGFLEEWR